MPDHARNELPAGSALLDLATAIAKLAGEYALDRAAGSLDVTTKSSSNDFVTQVDRDTERLIVEHLLRERPDDTIVGEEGAAVTGSSGVRWCIDPIDGTTNFVYGQPGWAVSIAAEIGESDKPETVVGVVFDPRHDELFAAARDQGATCNGEPISPRGGAELASAIIGTGFAYDPVLRTEQARVLSGVLPAVGNIRRVGSAAIDLCWVGRGRLDAYYETGLNRWDYAAGALIAAEAGAVVDDLRGHPPSPDFTFASSKALHNDVRDLLVALDADGSNGGRSEREQRSAPE